MFGRIGKRGYPADQKPGITDIHCHILPGVDDGSHSMSQSRRMLDLAWENGIRAIIATPHFMPEGPHPSADTLCRLAGELREYIYERSYDMRDHFNEEVPVGIEDRVLTLETCIANKPDKRYIVQAVLEAEGEWPAAEEGLPD